MSGEDPEVRLEAAVRGVPGDGGRHRARRRKGGLRLSLETDTESRQLPLRQGRAIGWFTEALEPLADQLGDDGVRRLAIAVRAVSGIESLVWLTDIAGLTREQAVEQMVWSAVALVRRMARGDG